MRVHLIFASVLLCSARILVAQDAAPTADEIVASMYAHDTLREEASGGYTGTREYLLENHRFQKSAQMMVRVTCDQNGTKHFDLVSEDGWKSANKRVLRQMVESEADSSRPEKRPNSRITSDNYTFRLIDTEQLEGRSTYVIEAVPKREDKSLFRGRIWVDAVDYALARAEGEPAKNPSFWTREVHFIQEYYKSGAYWFPLETTSVTEARVFGTTEVSIRYLDYQPTVGAPAQTPDYPLSEARYAKR